MTLSFVQQILNIYFVPSNNAYVVFVLINVQFHGNAQHCAWHTVKDKYRFVELISIYTIDVIKAFTYVWVEGLNLSSLLSVLL